LTNDYKQLACHKWLFAAEFARGYITAGPVASQALQIAVNKAEDLGSSRRGAAQSGGIIGLSCSSVKHNLPGSIRFKCRFVLLFVQTPPGPSVGREGFSRFDG
jgi:hypothetical protein